MDSASLEMIPPIPGKEKLFGWYPPAHSQYAKVPYKSMAVLGDYKIFTSSLQPSQPDAKDHSSCISTDSIDVHTGDNLSGANTTVLSTKLNAIRHELSRKQIHKPHFNSVKEYMGIPEDWKGKFPEPNLDILIDGEPKINNFIPKTIISTDKPNNNAFEMSDPMTAFTIARQDSRESGSIQRINSNNSNVHQSRTKEPGLHKDPNVVRCRTSLALKEVNLNDDFTTKVGSDRRPHTAPGYHSAPFKPQHPSRNQSAKPQTRQMQRRIASATNINAPGSLEGGFTEQDSNLKFNMSSKHSVKSQSEANIHQKISRQTTPINKIPNPSKETTYEEDLDKYRWLMQVHGDPFQLKKPHIVAAVPFFCRIPDTKVQPQQPKMYRQNRDTFFYNTIPYNSASFEIHPSFTSEKYNHMKNQLRKQGKWNYTHKNFSFVY